jgi:hypothetical protein
MCAVQRVACFFRTSYHAAPRPVILERPTSIASHIRSCREQRDEDQPLTVLAKQKRLLVLLISVVAVVATILVAASLGDVSFSPGYALLRREDADLGLFSQLGLAPENTFLDKLIVVLYAFGLLMVPVSILLMIISRQARKWILRSLGIAIWIVAIYLVMRSRPEFLPEMQLETELALPSADALMLSLDFPADPPWWIAWAMAIGLALFVSAVLVGTLWLIWRSRLKPTDSLEQLAREAQGALDALKGGADLRDTVVRCYFEMSRVLSEERGIRRERAMTPREFEVRLGELGLPERDVVQLTRLFEGVRYGSKATGEREADQAVASLSAIVDACRSAA